MEEMHTKEHLARSKNSRIFYTKQKQTYNVLNIYTTTYVREHYN